MNHSRYITSIKTTFILVITGLMIIFVIASSVIKSSPLTDALSPERIAATILTIGYRTEYAFAGGIEPLGIIKRLAGTDTAVSAVGKSAGPSDRATTIPVLVYHGITDSPHRGDRDITTRKFKRQMFALKMHGYETITIDDLYQWKRGEIELPVRSFLLTYDDGRSDSYYGSDPVLKALGYHAVMFTISKWGMRDKGGYYLSRGQLVGMERSDTWEIQAHARNAHEETYSIGPRGEEGRFFANKLWLPEKHRLETEAEYERRIEGEFAGAKSELEASLAIPDIIAYAFPFSDFGQHVTNFPGASKLVLEKAGTLYKLVFYQNKPGIYFSQTTADSTSYADASFLIRRIEPTSTWTTETLLAKLENGNGKPLPYTDDFSANRGWIAAWNPYSLAPGAFALKAADGSTGAASLLDGTQGWIDYDAQATVVSPSGASIFLWARFKDDRNNAGCNFGRGFVHVEQTVGSIHTTIQGTNATGPLPDGDFVAGIRVRGRSIECTINGVAVAGSHYLDASLNQGGFGIKTWDHAPGLAHIIVKRVEVKALTSL